MNVFLQELSLFYQRYRVVIILDKAGWHLSKSLSLPANIQLLHLAAYSPELNPVELLWRETRRRHFHNKIFDSLDSVEDTLYTALYQWHTDKTAVQRLAAGYVTY